MTDICIFYARQDEGMAEKLYSFLSARWNVWWDREIVGSFADAIEREVSLTACVVPIWSESSRANANFGDELRLAKKHGRTFIPVRIDNSDPPYGYGDLSSVDLRGWTDGSDHPSIRNLADRIARATPAKRKSARPTSIGGSLVRLPALFLSVSSHETRLPPLDAIRALRVFGADTLLVSAYDLASGRRSAEIIDELARFRDNGGFVLADSGNYEATRIGDQNWRSARLKSALAGVPLNWACSFDVMKPSVDPLMAANRVVTAVERDRSATGAEIIPIVHARQIRGAAQSLSELPAVIRSVAERLAPPMIAVPERELGEGLVERARMVRRIRTKLDELPFYQPLHLLGTGNPWSIAVLAAAGADSFDGLEWCRFAFNAENGMLHHLQHFDFFAWQAREAISPIAQAAVDDAKVDYAGKVAFHNLEYFRAFCRSLRDHSSSGRMEVFITGLLGPHNAAELTRQMPELFV